MNSIYVMVNCAVIIVAIVMVFVAIRSYLKRKSITLSNKLMHISSYAETPQNKTANVDIRADIENSFLGKIISATQVRDFINHYRPYYNEAYALVHKLKIFKIVPSDIVSSFICDFEAIDDCVKCHNENVIILLLDKNKDFFDHCLTYPLDKQQRRSIVSEEDNCLVISSAGSGKTSSIVGKVKYLIEVQGVSPEKILLISYTNKAAAELTERINTSGLRGYTFHKLAIDIIGQTTGVKPSIYDNTDALFIDIYHKLLEDSSIVKSIVEYFVNYEIAESSLEQVENERREQLSERKSAQIKALLPDMDGRKVYVRSVQEQKICFILSSLGVNFRYEEPYEYRLADEMHSQYRPDFSIYFNQDGETRRIYLEHFGVDEHSFVPKWFAKDKNMTFEEANKRYNDGIAWKKAVHEKYGTELLVTSSADFNNTDVKEKLRKLLSDAGVPIIEKTDEELYNVLLPKDSKQEKAFIRLIVTFVTLVKSSCKPIAEILQQAKYAGDQRSEFIIKNIFKPVYDSYIKALNDSHKIDFTDAILQAAEICRNSHPVEYDYIIVDEFQDISIDRYNFLKALREGKSYAKLFCVGDDWQSIYRFSGSDMALFNQFSDYFGTTDINKIETTYRFGEPLVSLSSCFIQRNKAQIRKQIHSFNPQMRTGLEFFAYDKQNYCSIVAQLVASIPSGKSIFLLGRYSFDDYYLSFTFKYIKEGNRFYYVIGNRKIEFLTVHKSKGLEADYVILLQCNKDTYGFPSLVSDDPTLNYVLTQRDQFPYGEERRLFYVAITRAKVKTMVMYDNRIPSLFVDEFLHPEKVAEKSYVKHPNANKKWTKYDENFLLTLHKEGKTLKYIAEKMGRSQTSIAMRLNKLKEDSVN